MKHWLSIICLGTLTIYCQAEEKILSSTIKAVTVYSDRAAITRNAEIKLPAGEHELHFENLPTHLESNSLQIDAQGTSPTTILDVTARQAPRLNNANARIQEIDDQIQNLTNEINKLTDKQTLLRNQTDFINRMQAGVLAPSKDAARPSAQEIQEIMRLSKNNLATILLNQRELTKQQETLTKQLSVLQNKRYPLQRDRELQVKNVTVRVNLQREGTVALNLTYTTTGATWRPNYDARFNTKDRKLSLNYLALVSQQTGEDWSNIKLTLSTAKPSLGGNAPTLKNWVIDEIKPEINKSSGHSSGYFSSKKEMIESAPMAAEGSMVAADLVPAATPAPIVKAHRQLATVDMGTTSASFNIEKLTSLPSDGSQQKVAIAEVDLESQLQYLTVPRLAQTAYLQASSINSSDYPLIAGKLNIFMDNSFIATSSLKTTMPKEELKLELGADEGIAVTYKQLKRFTEKTGFTSSSERITYEYQISVQNHKKTAEIINVMDHIPVSQDDRIKVVLLAPQTKDIEQDKEGKLTWKWKLEAGQKQEATLKFSVEYPINTRVQGLQ